MKRKPIMATILIVLYISCQHLAGADDKIRVVDGIKGPDDDYGKKIKLICDFTDGLYDDGTHKRIKDQIIVDVKYFEDGSAAIIDSMFSRLLYGWVSDDTIFGDSIKNQPCRQIIKINRYNGSIELRLKTDDPVSEIKFIGTCQAAGDKKF